MSGALSLFEAVGIELEYMIVEQESLDVFPSADRLLEAASKADGVTTASDGPGDVERGPITWSNELVAHVVELKCTEPLRLDGTGAPWRRLLVGLQENVRHANALLAPLGARLLPTGMHPWMDPVRETRLWPHEYREVYDTFDRLFDCRSHGWANLQSAHINLPFSGDEEFARLHAAVRVLLPILPAIAASSPVMEGRRTGCLDNRLEVYRTNSARVPSLTGRVIPEAVFSEQEYQEAILDPIRRDLATLDPEGHLQPEFSNARGAIARFDRGTVEIRLLDVQENPAADLLIAAAVTSVLQALAEERWCSLPRLKAWDVSRLEPILHSTIRTGGDAVLRDADYLRLFGVADIEIPMTAEMLWERIFDEAPVVSELLAGADPRFRQARLALEEGGCLARRICGALTGDQAGFDLAALYHQLARALHMGESFTPSRTFSR